MRTTKFKPSEIGPIPVEWEVKRLGEFGAFKNGISKGADSFGHGVPFVNLLDVFGKSRLTSAEGLGLVEASHAEIADCGLKQGDTLFVRSSVKPEGVGLATVIDGELPNTVFSGFLLRYRDNELEVGYKRYAFAEAKFRRRVIAASTVSANTNVNQTALKGLFVPVPPLPEQRRIATALSDTDAWIESLDKLIEKKKLVKQGTMQALLSGKNRLPGFSGMGFKMSELGPIPVDWEVKQLGEVCADYAYGTGTEAIDYDGENAYIRITDIDEDSHLFSPSPLTSPASFSEKHIVKDNDLLVARTGASVGKTYFYSKRDGKLIFAGFLMKANVQHADGKYVFYWTLTDAYKSWVLSESARSGQPGLNIQQLKNMPIALPPRLEQKAIAAALSDMDAELVALSREKAKAEQIKQGMMQELLTGRVRLGEGE